jgi:hypothetical protein
VKAGHAYVDVGTLHGYRTAMAILAEQARSATEAMDLPLPAWSDRGEWASSLATEARR